MARKGRFTEARIYAAGTSLALLLGVWGILAAQDADSHQDVVNAQTQTSAANGGNNQAPLATRAPGRRTAPQATRAPVVHVRTRAS